MPIFELHPVSRGTDFTAAWFDDEELLWSDERLRRAQPLSQEWQAPALRLYRPEQGATPVLFNPHALAVCGEIRESLSCFKELEFLPVEIEGHGVYFILHIVAALELPEGAVVRRPSPPANGNVVLVEALPRLFEPPVSFFRILQPADSPAGRSGKSVLAEFATVSGAEAIARCADGYICAKEVPGA